MVDSGPPLLGGSWYLVMSSPVITVLITPSSNTLLEYLRGLHVGDIYTYNALLSTLNLPVLGPFCNYSRHPAMDLNSA